MDDVTAFAFAAEAFEALHPRTSWPTWLWQHAMRETYTRDAERNFIVAYVWKPRVSCTGAESFFEVRVNAWTAETTVLLDTPLDRYRQDELEEYL